MSERNLRRIVGKKNAQDLARTIHVLKESAAGLNAMGRAATSEFSLVEEAIREFTKGIKGFEYRLDRQRAVFLRFVHEEGVIPYGDSEELLEVEARYGAEYDAMRFLAWLAMLGEGEEP
jgi:hypothetical protein